MRVVYGVLSLLMLLFMAVQYNDPDGLLWMGIYAIPAVWCALAALWRQCFEKTMVQAALWFSLALSAYGVVYFWPLVPGFWRKSVWIDIEIAREGMGMMIVSIVLATVLHTAMKTRKKTKAGFSECAS